MHLEWRAIVGSAPGARLVGGRSMMGLQTAEREAAQRNAGAAPAKKPTEEIEEAGAVSGDIRS
jgi:hypothetical protein